MLTAALLKAFSSACDLACEVVKKATPEQIGPFLDRHNRIMDKMLDLFARDEKEPPAPGKSIRS